MRILNSSLRWEGGEVVYAGGGEGGRFLVGDWVLGGGVEKLEDGYSLKGDFSLGGVLGQK